MQGHGLPLFWVFLVLLDLHELRSPCFRWENRRSSRFLSCGLFFSHIFYFRGCFKRRSLLRFFLFFSSHRSLNRERSERQRSFRSLEHSFQIFIHSMLCRGTCKSCALCIWKHWRHLFSLRLSSHFRSWLPTNYYLLYFFLRQWIRWQQSHRFSFSCITQSILVYMRPSSQLSLILVLTLSYTLVLALVDPTVPMCLSNSSHNL